MSLRKVDISELMDAYEDTEFLPEEDVSVNTDKIKQEVANIVKGKRRTGRKLILLAAALAACLALAGWAWGERVYQFISGSTLSTGGNPAAGSVSVELARAARLGTVYAVEKNPEALPLLEENRRRFGAWNLRIVPGEAPGALAALPAPDRVFVGGSSGGLLEILRTAKEKNPGVRAVVNTVTLETLAEAVPALKACGFPEPDVVQLSAARARKAGNYHLMTGQNPVFILSAGGETDA